MYVRVVRFTDVSAERMQQLESRVREAGGPPPGVRSPGLEMLFDESQGTAVRACSASRAKQDMEDAAKVFERDGRRRNAGQPRVGRRAPSRSSSCSPDPRTPVAMSQ